MVRHGETDFNKKRLLQGKMNNPLNEAGIQQAYQTAKKLKSLNEALNYLGSSPLIRAKKTAEIIGEILDLPLSFLDENFIERDFGPFEGQLVDDILPSISLPDFKAKGYEDNEQLIQRIKSGLTHLYEKYSDQSVLFVAHSHVIKSAMILSDQTKYDFSYYIPNLGIVIFEINDQSIKVVQELY